MTLQQLKYIIEIAETEPAVFGLPLNCAEQPVLFSITPT